MSWIPVRGHSMWPVLRPDDALELLPLSGAPRPGDVVVARLSVGLVAHRVQAVRADAVLMRGDACLEADGWIPLERLLGRVERVRRGSQVLARGAWDRGPRWLGRARQLAVRGLGRLVAARRRWA